MIDKKLWPARGVGNGGGAGIDPEVVIERRNDFLHVNRTFDWVFAQAIGGANGLSSSNAATGQKR